MTNPTSVLFLDVDGVLNCVGTRERLPDGGTVGLEPGKLDLLRDIINQTGASIVLSSTWRKYRDLVNHLWRQLGGEMKKQWIGSTPCLDTETESGIYVAKVRGDEIQAWLDEHPSVERFVILDDDADMAHLHPHLLRTHGCEGLTQEIAAEAIHRLTQKIQ